MKLPSLQHVVAEATRVIRRFPLTLLCALLLCVAGIYSISLDYAEEQKLDCLFPLASAAALGLTLTLSMALAAERYRWPLAGKLAAALGAAGLLVLWYVVAPAEPNVVWKLRLLVLLVASHLLVAVVPYLPELRREADTPGFWRYNETLFLRILTAGLYSGVLFAGCALALVAIEKLFEVHIDGKVFGYLFTVLATLFNTWFFLAGVPADFAALEQEAPYPKGLKVFTQFVLLPLVVLYLGILYAYLGRILVQWELPKGWVSILILVFSVAGIFALLLIHPIRDAAENTWIRTFGRWFYRALLPLLGLLFVAIITRVQTYGVTEERYFVLVLAGWLALMLGYFLWRQGRGIIWIPASLAVLALLSAVGPWGAFAVSERSQTQQLAALTSQHQLLQNGKLDQVANRMSNLPKDVTNRIASIFEYFAERNELARLQPFFSASLVMPDSVRHQSLYALQQWASNRLQEVSGVQSYNRYTTGDQSEREATFTVEDASCRELGGGRYWFDNLSMYNDGQLEESEIVEAVIRPGTFRLRTTGKGHDLHLEQLRADGSWQRRLSLSPGATADSLSRRYGTNPANLVRLPGRELVVRSGPGPVRLTLFLQHINRQEQQKKVFYTFGGHALLELPE